jgi:anti-anti-sigma factor
MVSSNAFAFERQNGAMIILPAGHMGSLAIDELLRQRSLLIETIERSGARFVLVDLSDVEYFGSMLLDTLCLIWKRVRQRDGRMAVCNVRGVAADILRKSRLNTLWPLYASCEDALHAMECTTPSARAGLT